MARRNRKRRGSSSSHWAVVSILGLVLFIGAAVSGMLYLKVRAGDNVTLDENLCPVTGPISVSAMLLDVTDPISELTKIDLQHQFQKVVAAVPKGGLIEVYLLTENVGKLNRTFHGCNPGDGSSADPWTSNPRKIEARWKEAFSDPLEKILAGSDNGQESQRSPIMAGIQRIAVESFLAPGNASALKTLYVASDMMEHTDAFSLYRSGTDYATFEDSQARDRFRTPLDGIELKILAFQREGLPPGEKIAEFWAAWVKANRGDFIGYERLTGVK